MPFNTPLCPLEWIVVFSMQTSNLGKLDDCIAQHKVLHEWWLGGISPNKKQPHQAFIQLLAARAQFSLAFSYARQRLGLVATFLFLEQMPVMGTGTGLIWDKVSCTRKTLYTEIGQLLAQQAEKQVSSWRGSQFLELDHVSKERGEVGTLQLVPHATWLT